MGFRRRSQVMEVPTAAAAPAAPESPGVALLFLAVLARSLGFRASGLGFRV